MALYLGPAIVAGLRGYVAMAGKVSKSGSKSTRYQIGNVKVKIAGSFKLRNAFSPMGELKENFERKIASLVKRYDKEGGFFRLQMGADTTMFHGDRKSPDYSASLRDLLFRFFSTMSGSDLGARMHKIPAIKILHFSDKVKTRKHAKAVAKKGKKLRDAGIKRRIKEGSERKRRWREEQNKKAIREHRNRSCGAKRGWKTRRANIKARLAGLENAPF